MLRLKIRTNRTTKTVEVDPSADVGSFLLSFVKTLGYPVEELTDSSSYGLRLVSHGNQTLPHQTSFAELQIEPGSVLLLEAPRAQAETIPITTDADHTPQRGHTTKTVSRRAFTRTTLLFLFGASGLMTGLSTGFVQHSTHSSKWTQFSTSVPPTSITPTRVSKQFVFAQHTQPVHTVSWSKDGRTIASGAGDATVLVWTKDGDVRHQFPHPASVQTLAWAPDNQRIVTGSGNEVAFWNTATDSLLQRFNTVHSAAVTSVTWAPNGQMQVVSASEDTRALLWSTANENYQVQSIFTLHTTPIQSASFADDGQTVATASLGGLTRVWSAENGSEVHGYFQTPRVSTRVISFSPTDPRLAVGSDDGRIRLWENGLVCPTQSQGDFGLECMVAPQQLQAHTKPVRSLAWSPSGKLLASGGEDGHLVIWAPSLHSFPLFTIQHPDAVLSLAWGATDQHLAAAAGNAVTLWAFQ